MLNEPFALLDDCNATSEAPSSRLLSGFVREHRCGPPQDLDAVCAAVEQDLQQGLHGVLLADYEWGVRLIGANVSGRDLSHAALRVLMFARSETMSRAQVDAWLVEHAGADGAGAAGFFGWRSEVDDRQFAAAIERIKALIAAGETYQINYTYPMHGWALGDPVRLYGMLRSRQPVPYGALIRLPAPEDPEYVLSLSPELFLSFDGERLLARPMKGTAPAAGEEGDRRAAAASLSSDPKNRAENVMIVDLLRNDLGRIARPGTVRVPRLFEVSRHGDVLQMTSDVEGVPRQGTTLADILRATFPCGSITGAPKIRSVELIAQLETSERGLYTGAIGWLGPAAAPSSLGPFCLSVAIRTLLLGQESAGLRPVRFGVGSGIVTDSDAAGERSECQLKAGFVLRHCAGFELLETMYAADGAVPLLSEHLVRLRSSAAELGFACDATAVAAEVEASVRRLGDGAWRLRIALRSDGRAAITWEPLPALEATRHWMLTAPLPPGLPNRLSRHKTTLRRHYDAGVQRAMAAGAFDTLYHAADGRLVDGGRSSVLVRLGDAWYTPPVEDGALPGIVRSILLRDPGLRVFERTLYLQDLQEATAVMACNGLRGIIGIQAVGAVRYRDVPQAVPVPDLLRSLTPPARYRSPSATP